MIQSLRHLTMKKVAAVHDDSVLSKTSSIREDDTSNPFAQAGFNMEWDTADMQQPAFSRRSTMMFP